MNNGLNLNDSASVDSYPDPFACFYVKGDRQNAVAPEGGDRAAMRALDGTANIANAAPQANGHNEPARVDQAGQGGLREAQRNDRGLVGLANGLRPLSAGLGGADAQPLVRFGRVRCELCV